MAYLLDSNVFIEAKRRHYGMDFCPAFWDWLIERNGAGDVLSIEQVADELEEGGDELSAWAAERGRPFFMPADEAMLAAFPKLTAWVHARNYRPAAVTAFLQDTDYHLVAYALAHGHVVVTHEIPSDGEKRVKIPNACIGMDVKYMTPFTMLRRERARFVLGREVA
jgi:hypothetical protein